ncbi:MAG: hypothetical protein KDD38_03775 [Bdellovibrionales bacterium]|nr:hypothetical protein [Bdellovibrionales bacterium]
MSFDELVNVKMPEVEIFDRVAVILQQNFHKYQDVNVVLPLNDMDGPHCSIQEVRLYSRHDAEQVEAKREYMMGGPNHKTSVLIDQLLTGSRSKRHLANYLTAPLVNLKSH